MIRESDLRRLVTLFLLLPVRGTWLHYWSPGSNNASLWHKQEWRWLHASILRHGHVGCRRSHHRRQNGWFRRWLLLFLLLQLLNSLVKRNRRQEFCRALLDLVLHGWELLCHLKTRSHTISDLRLVLHMRHERTLVAHRLRRLSRMIRVQNVMKRLWV